MWGLYVLLSAVFIIGGAGLTAKNMAESEQTPAVEVQQIETDTAVEQQQIPGEAN